ncbi:VOC family protein [Rhizobium sp. RU36D]|uniref:VOC family protein n=1 Tax=Rhizobium sp. RU36D TaxID=1907415 RepID=UPI0009D7CFC3|nr:VOC family protein [Rhizobium sp. RU36D]SMC68471.1 Glyoxalase-like domain-containing protein [Rhizobium sp. RU36D]
MTDSLPAPRPLDHLVLPVADLSSARERLVDLGFTVAADAKHPFGTENACVFFENGSYLEPLAVASREECDAAARQGNVFVARDQAFRFRCGEEGLSAIVVGSEHASVDHNRFREAGFSAGDMLSFSRPMLMSDGSSAEASFALAFAADLRSPDFFLFSCQRVSMPPVDRAALTRHANGVTGISAVVLGEENPSDFQYLLEVVFEQRDVRAHSFGIELTSSNCRVEVLTSAGLKGFYGIDAGTAGRGLCGRAVVFSVTDLGVTEKRLADRGVAYSNVAGRLVVAPGRGQGVAFAFEEAARA